jgi:hypothetical protein
MAAISGSYLTALADGSIAKSLFWWRIASMIVGSLILSASLRYSVQRKRQAVDDVLGPTYRRFEVLGTIACVYLFVLAIGLLAVQDVLGIYLLTNIAFLGSASVLLQIVVLLWVSRKSVRNMLTDLTP